MNFILILFYGVFFICLFIFICLLYVCYDIFFDVVMLCIVFVCFMRFGVVFGNFLVYMVIKCKKVVVYWKMELIDCLVFFGIIDMLLFFLSLNV